MVLSICKIKAVFNHGKILDVKSQQKIPRPVDYVYYRKLKLGLSQKGQPFYHILLYKNNW
jgi:hypothetical protein